MIRLEIDKAPARTRVVVAMSGGVDSSVTAALLAEAGYEVIGVTLRLYDSGAGPRRPGACCAGIDIHDARHIAGIIGIPHYVLDYQGRFREEVVESFADSYVRGETPVPCVTCNRTVKFRDLLRTAQDLGADALATGHYVRRIDGPGGARLFRGTDATRDQSYFLFATTASQLNYLQFPLGGFDKDTVRDEAARLGLPVASKPDSQDICFVPDGDYASLVRRLRPDSAQPGDIVDVHGQVLGRHDGIIGYTVGQRRGLGVGGTATPLYVLRIEPGSRRIVVGPRSALGHEEVRLTGVNWLGDAPLGAQPVPVTVKLRSAQTPVSASVAGGGEDGTAIVRLAEPQGAVAPGQACVFYSGERVLGGGWIAREPQPARAA